MTNLPVVRDALIGRDDDIATARRLLERDDVGLLTLTGVGGSGKTRLAIRLASDLLYGFEDGAFFVPLAPVRDPALVPSVTSQALGLPEAAARSPEEALREHLRHRRVLLVLDNFEHLLTAGPLVSDLLAAAPGLKVLVTSRAPLRLHGEREHAVGPLALPDLAESLTPAAVGGYAAVALFLERAAAVHPGLTLTGENAPVVAEICVRLDGLPLALELAAVRCRVLSPSALLARLERRLALLIDGPRDAPERHRTLRDTVSWSYDLLDKAEQRLFRQLAVFVGGCTLEAAAAVCRSDCDTERDVLDVLTSLVSKSLLRREDELDGRPRFFMLETIRDYAMERLDEADEVHGLQLRFAQYLVDLVERAEPSLRGAASGNRMWLDRMEAEQPNVRFVLGNDAIDPDLRLRLAAAFVWLWYVHAHHSEGRTWLRLLIDRADPASSIVRAKALHGLGILANQDGDFAEAAVHARAAFDASVAAGDRHGAALAEALRGRVARAHGDLDEAGRFLENSVSRYRELDDPWGMAYSLHRLGEIAVDRGEYERAEHVVSKAVALRRTVGDLAGEGIALLTLGRVALYRGDHARARDLIAESIPMLRAVGSKTGYASALLSLASLARLHGDRGRASALCREALVTSHEVGNRISMVAIVEELASLALDQGRSELAAQLLAAAAISRDRMASPVPPARQGAYQRDIDRARAALGEAQFASRWTEGGAMSMSQCVEVALHEDEPVATVPIEATPPARLAARGTLPLSRREREVVILISEGLSNREIADRLVLSQRTVERHIENVYNRLGISGRSGRAVVTAYALRHGLNVQV